VGWSTGGGVGMQFAANHPSYVQKLVLIASVSTRGYPFFKADEKGMPILNERLKTKKEISKDPAKTIPVLRAYGAKDKEFLRALWNMAIYTRHQPMAGRYEEYLEDMLTQRNLVDVYHALNTFNISRQHNGLTKGTGDAERIKAPVLVLQGENDLVVPEKMAIEIKQDLSDQAELIYLKNCGHSPLVDDLDQLLDVITSFLQKR
jgi:pimeloyl-ACP methyl ester carboxylesterase